MWIDIKGILPRINAAVSVKHLTDGQGCVLAADLLICEIANSQVVETDVLKRKEKKKEGGKTRLLQLL